ncbi:MAG: hypothetical protein CL799_06810 [Chromatiales bacterium]|jgi:outer membrane receptor protein involved in Fe transport|nr:hypothetical protein [Chromatiales bacterium]
MMKSRKTVIKAVPVRVTPIAAAVATAMGSFAGVSIAADDVATKPEIKVTATRRDTTMQEVPYSLSVLDSETLKELQIDNLSGIARWTPGLIQVDQGARDGSPLIMRGMNVSKIDSPEFLQNTSGGRVATYYGETPIYLDLKLIDVERVEVLQGPQGTLYGAKSLGGAVRYIPAKPDTEEFTVDAHVSGWKNSEAADPSVGGDLVINVPLIEDTLALRAILGYSYDQGFIDYNYLVRQPGVSCSEPGMVAPECPATPEFAEDDLKEKEDVNDNQTKTAGLSLLWNISDMATATLSWRHQGQKTGGRNINSSAALELIEAERGIDIDTGKYVSGMRVTEPNERDNDIFNLRLDFDFDNVELVSSTSYSEYDQDGRRDQTDLLLWFEYSYETFPAFVAFTVDKADEEIFTQELRLVSKDDSSRVDWIAGLYFTDSDYTAIAQEYTPGFAAFAPWLTEEFGDLEYDSKTAQDSDEFALFGELGIDLTDRWNIRGGMRWFDVDASVKNCATFPMFSTLDPGINPDVDAPENCISQDIGGNVDDDDVLIKLSTSYDFSEELTGYAIASQGYTDGIFNARTDIAPGEVYVKPEEVDNYEFGIKGQFMDGQLSLNAALFYMDWKNTHLQGKTESGSFLIMRNGGPAESKGIELDAQALLGDSWTLSAGYAYTRAELAEGCTYAESSDPDNDCAIPNAYTAEGDELPGAPENQGHVRLTYSTVLDNGMGLHFDYGFTAQSEVLTTIGDSKSDACCREGGEELPGYSVHFTSVGVSDDSWEASLFIDNLFDKYAETGVRLDQDRLYTVGPFVLRQYFKNVIRPRTVGVDFRYKFN